MREPVRVARDVLDGIPPGSLILGDLGYFAFAWFDDLIDLGFHFVSRLRNKTSYKVLHTHYSQGDTFDGIVQLGAYRADRMAHAVRLVTFRQGPYGQIFHALHVEIAGRAGVDIFDVSLPLLIEYMPLFARNGENPVAGFVEHGRELHFIRPSRRIAIIAPTIPDKCLVPLPPDIEITFQPRYDHRKCGKRSQNAN